MSEAQSCCQVMGLSGSWWWHSGTGVTTGTKGTVAKRCHQQVRVVGRRHGEREGRGAYQGKDKGLSESMGSYREQVRIMPS